MQFREVFVLLLQTAAMKQSPNSKTPSPERFGLRLWVATPSLSTPASSRKTVPTMLQHHTETSMQETCKQSFNLSSPFKIRVCRCTSSPSGYWYWEGCHPCKTNQHKGSVQPIGSKYQIRTVSGSNNHTIYHSCFWDHSPEILGTWTLWATLRSGPIWASRTAPGPLP